VLVGKILRMRMSVRLFDLFLKILVLKLYLGTRVKYVLSHGVRINNNRYFSIFFYAFVE